MIKFSLRLCIWLALLVGSVLGLVLDREPWVLDKNGFTIEVIEKLRTLEQPGVRFSPDKTRAVAGVHESIGQKGVLYDQKTQGTLVMFPDMMPILFVDDDTLILARVDTNLHYFTARRRFPEWWWGIFYRPLFWIAVVVFFGTVFEFVSMRKRLRAVKS